MEKSSRQERLKKTTKPERTFTIEEQIEKLIKGPNVRFRQDGCLLKVGKVEDVHVLSNIEGDYLDENKKGWNHAFSGTARLTIHKSEIEHSDIFEIEGWDQVKDGECEEIFKIVTVKAYW